jgi:hypothetical protein
MEKGQKSRQLLFYFGKRKQSQTQYQALYQREMKHAPH